MSLAGLITRLQTEPIAMAPEYLAAILNSFEQFGEAALSQIETPEEEEPLDVRGATAIVPIRGAIMKGADAYDRRHGCCDVDAIRDVAQFLAEQPLIERVVFRISSPGGSALGVREAGTAIASLAEVKPVFAWTDTVAASAAYWLGSQARELYMSESARVGSIGVYSLYLDASKLLEKHGVNVNAIQAGKFKLAGAPFRAMSDDERAHLQRGVDRIHTQFKAAVTARRSLKEGTMEGQCFDGEDAVASGLADQIVTSFSDVLDLVQSR